MLENRSCWSCAASPAEVLQQCVSMVMVAGWQRSVAEAHRCASGMPRSTATLSGVFATEQELQAALSELPISGLQRC